MSKDKDERARRLAQALRENLRRRKARHRAESHIHGEANGPEEPDSSC